MQETNYRGCRFKSCIDAIRNKIPEPIRSKADMLYEILLTKFDHIRSQLQGVSSRIERRFESVLIEGRQHLCQHLTIMGRRLPSWLTYVIKSVSNTVSEGYRRLSVRLSATSQTTVMDGYTPDTLIKKLYNRLIRIKGSPRHIALGFALGIFIGMTPTMGFQMPIAAFFASIFGWNILSAALGVWITNPVTAPFIYGICYVIGAKLLGIKRIFLAKHIDPTDPYKLFYKAPEILGVMTVGGIILGIPLAIAAYFFAYSVVRKYQEDIKYKIKHRIEAQLTPQKGSISDDEYTP